MPLWNEMVNYNCINQTLPIDLILDPITIQMKVRFYFNGIQPKYDDSSQNKF